MTDAVGLSRAQQLLGDTVAALTPLYRAEQLRPHLRLALDNGLGGDELVAAITHPAFYAGWPNAMSAITELKKITEV